jgi:hypothetical protein
VLGPDCGRTMERVTTCWQAIGIQGARGYWSAVAALRFTPSCQSASKIAP